MAAVLVEDVVGVLPIALAKDIKAPCRSLEFPPSVLALLPWLKGDLARSVFDETPLELSPFAEAALAHNAYAMVKIKLIFIVV